jgi:hypothetical protein
MLMSPPLSLNSLVWLGFFLDDKTAFLLAAVTAKRKSALQAIILDCYLQEMLGQDAAFANAVLHQIVLIVNVRSMGQVDDVSFWNNYLFLN